MKLNFELVYNPESAELFEILIGPENRIYELKLYVQKQKNNHAPPRPAGVLGGILGAGIKF